MEKDSTIFNTPIRNDSDPASDSFHGDEKGHHTINVNGEEEEVDSFIRDPYRPFDDLPPEKPWVMTIRAVFVGLCCGCLVNASNIYLGLKTGWTFGANLFGVSIFITFDQCSYNAPRTMRQGPMYRSLWPNSECVKSLAIHVSVLPWIYHYSI